MLGHTKLLLERGYITINPKFHKLVTSLGTAVDNDGSLDKQIHCTMNPRHRFIVFVCVYNNDDDVNSIPF